MNDLKTLKLKQNLICTIDIGSNSLLMLGSQYKNKKPHIVFDHFFMPRLAQGIAHNKSINSEAISRAYKNLVQCKKILDAHALPYKVFITASSAIREATNQKLVLEHLEQVFSNTPIEIISGNEEARLSYLSIKDCFDTAIENNFLFDIGGGSTEIALGNASGLIQSQSIKFGTVKLLDLFFKEAVSMQQIKSAAAYVLEQLADCQVNPCQNKSTSFFGTAGSFTQCASMMLGLKHYNISEVDGFKLKQVDVNNSIKKILGLSNEQIKLLPGIDPKRADVLLPGLIIIQCLMQFFKIDLIQIYDRGIRFGKLFDVIQKFSPADK